MSRLEQRWRVLRSVLSIVNCRFHCSSPGVTTLLFSLSMVVSGMCGSLFGSQLLQTPLTVSLMVLMSSCPLGEQHVSVFCLRYLMVPNLQTGVRVPFVGVSSVRCVICTLCCWCLLRHEVWAWLSFVAPGS